MNLNPVHHQTPRRRRPAPIASRRVLAAVVRAGGRRGQPRFLRVGDGYAATLIVTGYPAEVGPAWLEPLLSWPGRLDVALHIDPLPPPTAAARLRSQRARFESSRRADADKGRLADPMVEAAADDAADLADRLARGAAKLFRVGLYLTVHARTETDSSRRSPQVRAAAASILLDAQPATWRHLQGWTTTLPLATDSLRMRRIMDTQALAAAFPLASADLPAPLPGEPAATGGVLYGINPDSGGHRVVGPVGAAQPQLASSWPAPAPGSRYLVKLDVLRTLYRRRPGRRSSTPKTSTSASPTRSAAPSSRLGDRRGADQPPRPARRGPPPRRPDPPRPVPAHPHRGAARPAAAAGRTGRPGPGHPRRLPAAGITADPATWTPARPAAARPRRRPRRRRHRRRRTHLAARLAPWVDRVVPGPVRRADHHPPGRAPGRLVAPAPARRTTHRRHAARPGRDLARRRPAPRHRAGRPPRRLVVVDEAWLLLRDGEGAQFLFRLAKAGPQTQRRPAVITQDAADVLGTDLGQAVVANAATQILLRQAPQAIDAVADAFGADRRRSPASCSPPAGARPAAPAPGSGSASRPESTFVPSTSTTETLNAGLAAVGRPPRPHRRSSDGPAPRHRHAIPRSLPRPPAPAGAGVATACRSTVGLTCRLAARGGLVRAPAVAGRPRPPRRWSRSFAVRGWWYRRRHTALTRHAQLIDDHPAARGRPGRRRGVWANLPTCSPPRRRRCSTAAARRRGVPLDRPAD